MAWYPVKAQDNFTFTFNIYIPYGHSENLKQRDHFGDGGE